MIVLNADAFLQLRRTILGALEIIAALSDTENGGPACFLVFKEGSFGICRRPDGSQIWSFERSDQGKSPEEVIFKMEAEGIVALLIEALYEYDNGFGYEAIFCTNWHGAPFGAPKRCICLRKVKGKREGNIFIPIKPRTLEEARDFKSYVMYWEYFLEPRYDFWTEERVFPADMPIEHLADAFRERVNWSVEAGAFTLYSLVTLSPRQTISSGQPFIEIYAQAFRPFPRAGFRD